jgi:hypothetical protein
VINVGDDGKVTREGNGHQQRRRWANPGRAGNGEPTL